MQHMKSITTVGILIVLFIAGGLIRPAMTTIAQEDNCRGVDLVVLLDQSRSMENNDPDELRIDAARLIVDSLGNNILYDCIHEIHRLAVIGFGDQPNDGLDTVAFLEDDQIAPKLEEFSEWEKNRKKLKDDKIPKPSGFLGGTDFLSAFQRAESILDKWALTPIGDESRLRGIVLIADGGPCVIDRGCYVNGPGMNWRGYLDEIQSYLDPNGNNLPFRGENNQNSVKIWFVGFNDTTAPSGFDFLNANGPYGTALRDFWQRITEQHGGTFVVLSSGTVATQNRDISKQIALIVDDVTGSELIPTTCAEPFYIDPYLDRAIIRILKIGSNPDVPLEDVKVDILYVGPKTPSIFSGGAMDGNAGRVADHIDDGPNEFYVIERPAPGTWKIQVEGADECRDLDVRYQAFPLGGEMNLPWDTLPQYDEAPFYDSAEPYNLNFEVFGGTEKAVQITSDEDFPLSVVVTVTQPSGATQTLQLVQNGTGPWQSNDPLLLPEAGTYRWTVKGESQNGAKNATIEHFAESGTFDVRSVKRFSIGIVEPIDSSQIALNRFSQGRLTFKPIRVVAQIYDAVTDQTLSPDEIANGSTIGTLSVQVTTVSGASEFIPMTYDPAENGWTTTLTPGEQGIPISIELHQISVILNDDAYDQESYRPTTNSGRQASVQMTRSIDLAGEIAQPTAASRIPQEDGEPFYDTEDPIYFTYQLVGYDLTDSRLKGSLAPERLNVKADISLAGTLIQSFNLDYDAATGLWRANKPLLVAKDGQYSWNLNVSARSDEDKAIVVPYTQNGTFSVSKVGRFHVEVIEPSNGQVYPLNRVGAGQTQDIPLPVRVVIVDDETGARLTDADLKVDANASQVISVTVRGAVQTSSPVALSYDSGSQSWAAILDSGLEQTPDEVGEQTLRAMVDTTAFDKSRYRPSVRTPNQDQVTFERVLIQPVGLESSVTQISEPIYTGKTLCFNAELLPLQAQFALVAVSGAQNRILDPKQVVDGDVRVAIAQLIDPITKNVLETGQIDLIQAGADTLIRVTIGTEHTQPGRYQIQIVPNPDALTAGYEFLKPNEAILIQVERTSNWLYAPATCGIAQTTGMVAASLLLLWMIYCFASRPVGLLEIVDERGHSIVDFHLGRTIGLLFSTKQTLKWQGDASISKIVVKKGASEDIDTNIFGDPPSTTHKTRAVEVHVYDETGSELGTWTLGSGQPAIPVTIDSNFKYT